MEWIGGWMDTKSTFANGVYVRRGCLDCPERERD